MTRLPELQITRRGYSRRLLVATCDPAGEHAICVDAERDSQGKIGGQLGAMMLLDLINGRMEMYDLVHGYASLLFWGEWSPCL